MSLRDLMPNQIKTISIRKDQSDWLKKKYINLSRFVQEKIDEEMKKEKINQVAKI